ncbi:TIR domain-containing protein [Halodesulfovibrio aestuarii]|uniref:MTH538 TIR-like domain n=1 Tax=Halodesulfovibrio aestuarii TaxID=126333 RepID=A0A8G2C7Z4_9BACT|nr:TIR domain-containing protein [Halodesulfovibrio aestuarii]SHI72910.1 MTH538 TIR-like domain [Halodesulfovibrio aestuarii]
MHKVFISYHHENDQDYKQKLLDMNKKDEIFIDRSVDTGNVKDNLPPEKIRTIIRDNYLKDTTVTILLVGTETKNRKHIDWELYSSMYNGVKNKQSGIVVIHLPDAECNGCTVAHEGEQEFIYPNLDSWKKFSKREEYHKLYPDVPERIIDNLLKENVHISVTDWNMVCTDPEKLRFLINKTFDDKGKCEYDMSRPMRKRNN